LGSQDLERKRIRRRGEGIFGDGCGPQRKRREEKKENRERRGARAFRKGGATKRDLLATTSTRRGQEVACAGADGLAGRKRAQRARIGNAASRAADILVAHLGPEQQATPTDTAATKVEKRQRTNKEYEGLMKKKNGQKGKRT